MFGLLNYPINSRIRELEVRWYYHYCCCCCCFVLFSCDTRGTLPDGRLCSRYKRVYDDTDHGLIQQRGFLRVCSILHTNLSASTFFKVFLTLSVSRFLSLYNSRLVYVSVYASLFSYFLILFFKGLLTNLLHTI